MKTKFLIIAALLSASLSLAQSFDFYVIGGITINQIDGDRIGGYNKLGEMFGAGIKRKFSERQNITLELDYIQKGKRSIDAVESNDYSTILHYIDLPIIAHYQIRKYTLDAGISLATLIHYKFLYNDALNETPTYTPNHFDIDYVFGVSYLASEKWSLSLRLTQSIIAMGDRIPSDTYRANWWTNPGAMYNRSLSIALQYHL